MSSDWGEKLTIAQLVSKYDGSLKTGPFGTTLKASEYASEGVPLISVREIGHGSFHVDAKTPRVSPSTVQRLAEYVLQEGDIVFARKGGIERCALIRKEQVGWFLGSDGIRLRPPKRCDARFLAYSLQTQATRDWLIQNSTGSTLASLNQATIGRLEISLPGIDEQVRVAEILEAFDDRIAVLRETNATLESIAQTLFKSWFVDFDPVHAKQQGIAPARMNEATAALFPATFEDSELGLVPSGWQVGPILDVASLLGGSTPRTGRPEYWGGNIPWASARDVSQSNDSVLVRTERTITRQGLDESATRIIPALASIVVARGATTGRMVLVGDAMAMNQTCYALTSKIDTPMALYCLLRREIDVLVHAAHGSVFDTITTNTFARSKVVQPSQSLLKHFEETVTPVLQQIVVGTKASHTLATLRDTLLPRLISGQLRLPEAEAHLTEAAA